MTYQLKLSNIPQRFQTINGNVASLSNVTRLFADSGTPYAAFKSAAKAVLDGEKTGLYLWSTSTGTGKSSAATALGVDFILTRVGQSLKRGQAQSSPYVYYASAPQYLEAVKRMYHQDDAMDDVTDVQNRMVEAELLIFDDVGVTFASESVQERLLSILEQRYERPTIYTSNCSLTQLEDRLGARIVSRIYGTTVEVHLRGVDNRRRAGE